MYRLNAVIWITALIILVAPAGTAFAAQGMGPDGKPAQEDEVGRPLKKLPKKARVEPEPPANKPKLPESSSLKDARRDPASAALSEEERRARLLEMYSKNPRKFRSNPRRALDPSLFQPEPVAASVKTEKTSPIAMIIGSVVSFILIVLLIIRMRYRRMSDPIRVKIPRNAPGDDRLPDEPPPDREKQMDWVEDYMRQQGKESEPDQRQNYSDFD